MVLEACPDIVDYATSMNNSAACAGSISTSRPSIFLLQPPHGLWQQADQARGPFGLTCFPGDQVLANFDFDIGELAAHGRLRRHPAPI